MRVLAHKGMPPRGSVQDFIATEMVRRDRRAKVAQGEYLARIFQAGLGIPDKVFKVWTDLLSFEIFQESYTPRMVSMQRKALKAFDDRKRAEDRSTKRMTRRLDTLEVKESDMRPSTEKELEEFKRKLRKARMKRVK